MENFPFLSFFFDKNLAFFFFLNIIISAGGYKMNLLTMSDKQIIDAGVLVIGAIWAIAFFAAHFILKYKRERRISAFKSYNRESQGIWDFTKKNFFFFSGLFGFVIFFTGLMMLIQGK